MTHETCKWTVVFASVLLVMAGPASASGLESFWTVLGPNGDPIESQGTGFGDREGRLWFFYPEDPDSPNPLDQFSWWNQWFHNGFDDHFWKEVRIDIWARPTNPDDWDLNLVLNWTTPAWLDPTAPPLWNTDPDTGERLIGRWAPGASAWTLANFEPGDDALHLHWEGRLPVDYCPEWLSIDVFGRNVEFGGTIRHHCVIPEPATMTLLGLGLSGFAVRRYWRKNKMGA